MLIPNPILGILEKLFKETSYLKVDAVCEDVLASAVSTELTLVRLHGLTETDDRLALREIARQMKLDNVVQDKVFGSFSEHLEFLLASLRTGDRSSSRPIAFILDEFDLFTEHRSACPKSGLL